MFNRLILTLCLPLATTAGVIPAGTDLHVRLLTQATSNKPSGQEIRAVVTAPVLAGETVVLPTGLTLSGTTADAAPSHAATDTSAETAAHLKLVFDRISDKAGHSQPVACKLIEVDNARETIDESGQIVGVSPSQTIEARIDQGIAKLEHNSPGLAGLLGGLRSSVVKDADVSITYDPGVDLTVELTKPLDWNQPVTGTVVPGSIAQVSELNDLVKSEPNRTVAENPPKPSDLTNLIFLGTQDQVTSAFEQSGWSTAAQLSRESRMETARAIIEDRGYSEAPVSILYLDGRPPDLTFQKQTDTFAKRHHIRIWRRPGMFEGKPIWIAAATHDIGIDFSRQSKSFTHVIDSNIDTERAKVVNDLVFTGMVQGLALVTRTNLPPDLSNATGDRLQTDGKIAVLAF